MSFKKFTRNIGEKIKLRRMQYIQDQGGIARRYIREKNNWDLHFGESKKFILKSAKTKNKGKVVVLGSGWLFDLPIEELANQFEKVVLIDIYHPKQILKKINKYSNVSVISADVTGGLIDYFYYTIKSGKKRKNKTLITAASSFSYTLPQDTDFVISLNIMCQLHIILVDYLKALNIYTASELKKLNLFIQQSHLKILPIKKSCLITDFEEEIYDDEDNLIGVNPLIKIDLPVGNFSNKWKWKFDSSMTYRDDAKTFFNTLALDF